MAVTIAVLITYYNEGTFLTECIESLRNSDRLPDEILIYDDASTLLPQAYLPRDFSGRVIRGSQNRGPSYGRNELLAAASCQYIHFHDADDLFAPRWYDEVRSRLEAEDLDAVFTEIVAYRDGQLSTNPTLGLEALNTDPDLVRFCLAGAMLVPSGTYRRECVLSLGGYSTKYVQSEDYDFHIRLAISGLRFGLILHPLVWQRLHQSNRSADQVQVWTDAVHILETLAGELDSAYIQAVCDALARMGRILFRIGALSEARNAFAIANRCGRSRFPGESPGYRVIARTCGPLIAERVGQAYRSLLSSRLRARLRNHR
jgi:glycosyltransferase involved in cell wall biosynthesis